MQMITEILKSDISIIIMSGIIILMIILYIINTVKLKKIQKNYNQFLNKIGNGQNIEEDLKKYMDRVIEVEKSNKEIMQNYHEIEDNLKQCIQKVGIVRYTAYDDIGSDLSFTLALLDDKDNGVVLNGIYSREMSNIYAKPIEKGKSTYTLSEQEKQAIEKAINIVKA